MVRTCLFDGDKHHTSILGFSKIFDFFKKIFFAFFRQGGPYENWILKSISTDAASDFEFLTLKDLASLSSDLED